MSVAPIASLEVAAPQGFWRGLLRSPTAAIPIAYVVLVALAAIFAPVVAPYSATEVDLAHPLADPSWHHLLGTDPLGRDLLSRLLYGARVSLLGPAYAVVIALGAGVGVGVVAGYSVGWFDRAVARLTDLVMSLPVIIVLLVVVAVFGRNELATMVALGALFAPGVMRVVRAATKAVRNELFIDAARVAGLRPGQIIVRHVLPRIAGPVIVQGTLLAASALLVEAGLGYLGLGVQPPTPSWGTMVADASTYVEVQPWLLVPSGGVLALTILAFGVLGDALRDTTKERSSAHVRPSTHRSRRATGAPAPPDDHRLLSVRDLAIAFGEDGRLVVDRATFGIDAGETVGLVGESGCGKTITALALLGLLPPGGRVVGGTCSFEGADLTALGERAVRRLRGSEIAYISQDPLTSLDPSFTVGAQLGEVVRRHRGGTRAETRHRVATLLGDVNLPEPEEVARRYPHELSGGMAQRVAIAIALAGEPKLLIADEPTTALDVTVQAEIVDLIRAQQAQRGMAVLLVTHDWGVVADLCERAIVMYAGHVMESADVRSLFARPLHPYTRALLDANPRGSVPHEPLWSIPGTVPAPGRWPAGCHFAPRCPLRTEACDEYEIPELEPAPGHRTRCLHHEHVAHRESLEVTS